MVSSASSVPRSCDLLDLVAEDTEPDGPWRADGSGRRFLVWLIDDRGVSIVRSAAGLAGAVDAARAYCAAWGGHIQFIEGPDGVVVDEARWAADVASTLPLPHVYTVEIRSPDSAVHRGVVSTLWTTTSIDDARRWRASLPGHLRRRSLIVSNAPDGRPNR